MKRGEAWERKLEGWHAVYARTGQAKVVKCHPGARMIRAPNGMQRLIYDEQGPPDYLGFTKIGGIAFEAKEIDGTLFPFKNLKEHQAVALDEYSRFNCFCFIAVRTMEDGRETGKYILPWSVMRTDYWKHSRRLGRAKKGEASIDVKAHGVVMAHNGWIAFALAELRELDHG